MRKFVSDLNLQNNISKASAEEAWSSIDKALTTAMERFVPKKKITGVHLCDPPWMNEKIKEKSRVKWQLYKEMRQHRSEENRNKYARIKNQVKWEVRKAVKQYEKKIAQESKTNPKAFYKYAKSKLKCKSQIPDINFADSTATSDREKADVLNQFFSSVFIQEDLTSIPEPDTIFQGQKLLNIIINEDMVKKELDSLNPNKSPGVDKHHPRVLKELKDQLVSPLTKLFKKSPAEVSFHLFGEWQMSPLSTSAKAKRIHQTTTCWSKIHNNTAAKEP